MLDHLGDARGGEFAGTIVWRSRPTPIGRTWASELTGGPARGTEIVASPEVIGVLRVGVFAPTTPDDYATTLYYINTRARAGRRGWRAPCEDGA